MTKLSMGLGTITVDGNVLGIAAVEIKDLSKQDAERLLELDQLKGSPQSQKIDDFRDSFKLICSFRNKPSLRSKYNKVEVEFMHCDNKHYVLFYFSKTKSEIFDLDGYTSVVFETHPNEDGLYGSIERGEHIC